MYIVDFTPRFKQMERETVHSLQSSADVKNAWNCTFVPLYVFVEWYLIMHRNKFTFTLPNMYPQLPRMCNITRKVERDVDVKVSIYM
jgi:hypothetical protein